MWETWIQSVYPVVVSCHLNVDSQELFLLVPCIWTGGEQHFQQWIEASPTSHSLLRDIVFQFIRDVYDFQFPFDGTITIQPDNLLFLLSGSEKELYFF